MRIMLVCGGISAEREVSLESAVFVRQALRSAGYEVVDVEIGAGGEWLLDGETPLALDTSCSPWSVVRSGSGGQIRADLVFPVLHGPYGEDGSIQGLCEMAGWRYAGSDVMTSSMAMNKIACRRMLDSAGIPSTEWTWVQSGLDEDALDAVSGIGFPVFVKPARLGSSVGISRASGPSELAEAVELALSYDEYVLIEREVENAREIEVSVLGRGGSVEVSVPGEVLPGRDWYDFEAKYDCPESTLVIPAHLEPDLEQRIMDLAGRAFDVLGGRRGYARVDFLLSGERIHLSEVNTIPGFTRISMFPKLWEASGLPTEGLMRGIVEEAMSRPRHGCRGSER